MSRASDQITQVSIRKTPQNNNADYEESKELGGRKMKSSLGVRNKEE